jgi:hypothetical protein
MKKLLIVPDVTRACHCLYIVENIISSGKQAMSEPSLRRFYIVDRCMYTRDDQRPIQEVRWTLHT